MKAFGLPLPLLFYCLHVPSPCSPFPLVFLVLFRSFPLPFHFPSVWQEIKSKYESISSFISSPLFHFLLCFLFLFLFFSFLFLFVSPFLYSSSFLFPFNYYYYCFLFYHLFSFISCSFPVFLFLFLPFPLPLILCIPLFSLLFHCLCSVLSPSLFLRIKVNQLSFPLCLAEE